MTDWKLLNEALVFATKAHDGQYREGTQVPYIIHPVRMMLYMQNILADWPHFISPDEAVELVVTAVLHDTVEDTPTTIQDIEDGFGVVVATFVEWLTKPEYNDPKPNRAWRKKYEREALAKAPLEVRVIKIVDRLDNISDLDTLDVGFQKLYLRESIELMEALDKGDLPDVVTEMRWAIVGIAEKGERDE